MLSLSAYFQICSILAFLFYGVLCLVSHKMRIEFERYGLSKFRILTGMLEVGGALGQLGGFFVPELLWISSLGLALLMLCGVWTRLRIGDPWFAFLPAIVLFLMNGWLVTGAFL